MDSFFSFPLKLRNRHFLVIDLAIFLITPTLALALRTDGFSSSSFFYSSLPLVTTLFLLVKLGVFYKGGMYSRFWRYASIDELFHIAFLGVLVTGLQTALFFLVLRPANLPIPGSIPLIDGMLSLFAVGLVRFSVRLAERLLQRFSGIEGRTQVVVAGAGEAGVLIVQEMQRNPSLNMHPVAFVDDDPSKKGAVIRGVPVLGQCKDVAAVAQATNTHQVIIAMPTAPGKVLREIVSACEQAEIATKTIPGIYELLGNYVSVNQLRDVQIEDLLRRAPIKTDLGAVAELLRGKRVLITGGGGSIGSELCRQALRFEPESLVILGHGENSIFEIYNELKSLLDRGLPPVAGRGSGEVKTQLHSVIADIRFPERMNAVFEKYQPQVVFHSAAHKHVHLMEVNPSEAVTNNVLGTRNVLEASMEVGVEHFVMISTDKAVNPTGVMGASKRAAELLVHRAAGRSGKPYVAVRFGNVLGSRGSVVLTFKRQISQGGPITITHPDMTRYFMTIPEAVQLVLQAAPLGRGGEVFMLDMGEPVKIVDLAHDLIELSGLQEGRDIDIQVTGMRPGEKLFEEMFVAGEDYKRTQHDKIFMAANASTFVPSYLNSATRSLEEASARDDVDTILVCLKELVPEFTPVGHSVEGWGRPPERAVSVPVSPEQKEQPAARAAGQQGHSDFTVTRGQYP